MTEYIKSGYRVIGPNTCDGSLHCWFFETEELANKFAAHLAESVDAEIEVCKFISCWRRKVPVEQIKAKDIE